ncbi:hypothetical protein [Desulfovibrio gilichinskyi]|uniref:Lipoprotein n=1 Tax=Desulfovibrio gilichinskyi TaxID=1519643 RepID=A0A1X7DTL7_9BACT|nr:hypothetical protein [Desulfovibrio gilichinskyi]SMF21170.1 hypothetical protein SAMN06295933_2321 [Desulfovibrio gilichinskyi]
MLTKIASALLFLILTLSLFGCAKIGETTGKTIKEVKEMPHEFHEGYKKGRTSTEDEI